jgi:hypothetical protein
MSSLGGLPSERDTAAMIELYAAEQDWTGIGEEDTADLSAAESTDSHHVDILQVKILPTMNQLQLLLRDRAGGRIYTAIISTLRVEDGDQTTRPNPFRQARHDL